MIKNSILIALITAMLSSTQAQEWTRFRGPNGQGRIETKGIPIQWTEADYAWKTPLPNEGLGLKLFISQAVFMIS